MKAERRRLFNDRPACFAALAVTLGVITVEGIYPADPLFRLIPLLIAAAVAAVILALPKTRKRGYIAVFFLIGVVAMSAACDIYDSRLPEGGTGVFTARVDSEINAEDGRLSFYIAEVYGEDGVKLNGEGRVYIEGDAAPAYGAGDTVVIRGELLPTEHSSFDGYFASAALNGQTFRIYADSVGKLADGDLPLASRILYETKRMFYLNTDSDTAAIATALVFGDRQGLDEQLYDRIRDSGLAHVLAVSGLHVTALATVVMWLLRKCKVNAKISFVVVGVLTFVYVGLCAFTPSALRSFVMALVLNFSTAFGTKRDMMSSLAVAVVLITVFSPFSVLHVGFELSVFAVLGMFLLASPLKRLMMKGVDKICPSRFAEGSAAFASSPVPALRSGDYDRDSALARGSVKVYDHVTERYMTVRDRPLRRALAGVSDAVSVSVSANLTAAPLIAYFFGSVQTLFIISNLIILPYMMFIYAFLMVITPFALITGLYGLAGIFEPLLLPFTAVARAVGGVSFASVEAPLMLVGGIAAELIAIIVSPFIFLPRRKKAIAVIVVLAVALCLSVPFSLL